MPDMAPTGGPGGFQWSRWLQKLPRGKTRLSLEQLLDKERNCRTFLDHCVAMETLRTQSAASSKNNWKQLCADKTAREWSGASA